MAATKNHDYHLVEPDPWPIIGAASAGIMFSGLVLWLHDNRYGTIIGFIGLLGVLVTMFNWWKNTITEVHCIDPSSRTTWCLLRCTSSVATLIASRM